MISLAARNTHVSRESSPIFPGHLTELTCIAKGRVPNLSLVVFAGFVAAIEKHIIENDIVQPSSFREDIPLDLVQLALIISSSIAAPSVYTQVCAIRCLVRQVDPRRHIAHPVLPFLLVIQRTPENPTLCFA